MWSCPGNMPKYYPGPRDILPSPTTETYTKYNNIQYSEIL